MLEKCQNGKLFQGRNWNFVMYNLFKSEQFPTYTITFRTCQCRDILPEKDSDFTPRTFNRRETIWWTFIQIVSHFWTKINTRAINPNVNMSAYGKCISRLCQLTIG